MNKVQNVLTLFLSLLFLSITQLFLSFCPQTTAHLSVFFPSCSLLCLLAHLPSSFSSCSLLCSFPLILWPLGLFFTSFSFPPLYIPSLLPASEIQTLPRVYFFDSYATLQANGSDSRFFPSSVCHARILHSHLLSHSFVYCLPGFW